MQFAKLYEHPELGQLLAFRTFNDASRKPVIYVYYTIDSLQLRRARYFPGDAAGHLAANLAFDALTEQDVVNIVAGNHKSQQSSIIVSEAGHA